MEQSSHLVVAYRRNESEYARESYQGLDVGILLPEIECELSLSDLYADVELTPIVSEDSADYQ